MGFCRPDSARCHVKPPPFCFVELPTGPGPRGATAPPPDATWAPRAAAADAIASAAWRRVAACGGVRRPAASLPAQRSGVQDAFCPARTVEMKGDRGRDASLRDTNAALADRRTPRVSSQ
jgi:hypothetical protein